MSLNRFAKKRDANERAIIAALEARGCDVEPLGDAPFDLLVTRDREALWLLEVKTKAGRLTPRQEAFRERFPVCVVRNVVEALAVVSDGARR